MKVELGEGIIACTKCNSKMKVLKCAKKAVAHVIVEDVEIKNTRLLYLVKL